MVKNKANPEKGKRAPAKSRGYTLLELVMGLFILALVTGAVFDQIIQMQKKSTSDAMRVDLSQQGRDFVNQTVRDLHMAGYPNASMYSNPSDPTKFALGLVSVSPTQILFEGDVNNDGTVQSVNIYYVANDPNDPNCPCIRRGAVPKLVADSLNEGAAPTYSETTNVFPPGTAAGQSGENLFEYYDQNGNPVTIGAGVDINTASGVISSDSGPQILAKIKTVKINLDLLTNLRDPVTNTLIRTSISATSRVNQ